MSRVVTALLLALTVAACGSDDDGGGAASSAAAAKTTYVAAAEAICAEANKREAAAGAPGPGWVYEPEFDDVRFLERFNAAGHEAVHRLRALEPPGAQRAAAGRMVEAIAEMVRALDGRIADLQRGTGKSSARVNAYIHGYSDLTPAAARLGLSECQGVSL